MIVHVKYRKPFRLMFFFLIVFIGASYYKFDANAGTLSKEAKTAYVKKIKQTRKSIEKEYPGWDNNYYRVTYRFFDVDGDGENELLMGGYDGGRGDVNSLIPTSVYKYKNSKAICVLKCPFFKSDVWQPTFYRYYSKNHTLVFESFSNTGVPRYELFYKWNGKKFILKVQRGAYYNPISGSYEEYFYDKGNVSIQKKLTKGKAKNIQTSWKGKVYYY